MIYTFYASKLMAYTDMTKYKLSRMTLEERIKFVNPYFNKAQVVQHVEDLLEAIVQTEFGVARIPKVLEGRQIPMCSNKRCTHETLHK
jgi:hypothetical protein